MVKILTRDPGIKIKVPKDLVLIRSQSYRRIPKIEDKPKPRKLRSESYRRTTKLKYNEISPTN